MHGVSCTNAMQAAAHSACAQCLPGGVGGLGGIGVAPAQPHTCTQPRSAWHTRRQDPPLHLPVRVCSARTARCAVHSSAMLCNMSPAVRERAPRPPRRLPTLKVPELRLPL